MTINYAPTDPTAGASRATAPTEVTRWTDYADTIADVDSRLDTVESRTAVYGFPYSVDPNSGTGYTTISVANRAVFMRVLEGGSISSIAIHVGTSSGNISVAAYTNSGTGRSARPTGGRLATSGAVACPTAGYAAVSLGSTVTVNAGDWLALSCDNTTATFLSVSNFALASDAYAGRSGYGDTMHPAPATPTITSGSIRGFVLIGV